MIEWNWLIYVTAAVVLLFYLYHTRLYVALCAGRSAFGIGYSVLWPFPAVRRARERAIGIEKKRSFSAFNIGKWDRFTFFRRLFPKINFEYGYISGVVSMPDAMYTCLIVGALRALMYASGGRVNTRVVPDFSGGKTHVEGTGIVSVKLGHIIPESVRFACTMMKKKGEKYGQTSD